MLKLIIAALCWLACFFAVRNNQTWRLYPQYVKVLFSVLFLDVFGAFVHAMWSGMVAEGEKYVVLMTSMATTLNVVSVLFVFVITQYSHLREILRGTILLFILNIFLLIFNFRVSTGSYFLSYFMIYSAIFLPYINRYKKLLFMGGILMAMFAFCALC